MLDKWTPEEQAKFCYAIASGGYSDYQIHCVFERLPDAISYLKTVRKREQDPEWSGWCWEYDKGDWGERIEPFQFWRDAVTPDAA